MGDQTRILVVDDDALMRRLLSGYLTAHGYLVTQAGDGWAALREFDSHFVDVAVVDVALPDGPDGLEVCRRIRAVSPVPVLLMSAVDSTRAKIAALEMGADDYMVKPFGADELLARIHAVLRRTQHPAHSPTLQVGDIVVDTARRQASRRGVPLRLTRTEFKLLELFVSHSDRTLTYAQIMEAVWGPGPRDVAAVHTHISHLRRKLAGEGGPSELAVAVPGVGYRFSHA